MIGKPTRVHPCVHMLRVMRTREGLQAWELWKSVTRDGGQLEIAGLTLLADWFLNRGGPDDSRAALQVYEWINAVRAGQRDADRRASVPRPVAGAPKGKEPKNDWTDRRDIWG